MEYLFDLHNYNYYAVLSVGAAFLIGAIISGVLSLGGNIANQIASRKNADRNLDMFQQTNLQNLRQYEDWKQYIDYSSQRERLKEAGFNTAFANIFNANPSSPFQFDVPQRQNTGSLLGTVLSGLSDTTSNVTDAYKQVMNYNQKEKQIALQEKSIDVQQKWHEESLKLQAQYNEVRKLLAEKTMENLASQIAFRDGVQTELGRSKIGLNAANTRLLGLKADWQDWRNKFDKDTEYIRKMDMILKNNYTAQNIESAKIKNAYLGGYYQSIINKNLASASNLGFQSEFWKARTSDIEQNVAFNQTGFGKFLNGARQTVGLLNDVVDLGGNALSTWYSRGMNSGSKRGRRSAF